MALSIPTCIRRCHRSRKRKVVEGKRPNFPSFQMDEIKRSLPTNRQEAQNIRDSRSNISTTGRFEYHPIRTGSPRPLAIRKIRQHEDYIVGVVSSFPEPRDTILLA